MATNQELTDLMGLELGTSFHNRLPHAKEVFKWQDIDLLPRSLETTILYEIYDWNGRNWRATDNNLVGYIFKPEETQQISNELASLPKHKALIPNFEFTKEEIIEFGFSIPALFNISFSGKVENTKAFSIKVNNVTESRQTNMDPLKTNILRALSVFAETETKRYRNNIKLNYLVRALFYAESVEIHLEKEAGVGGELSFDVEGVEVEIKVNTETKKEVKLTYTGNGAPFAASFIKGKDFALTA